MLLTVVEFNVDPCAVADPMARQVSTHSARVNFLFFKSSYLISGLRIPRTILSLTTDSTQFSQ